jgi:type I restriction enzyme, S subunit
MFPLKTEKLSAIFYFQNGHGFNKRVWGVKGLPIIRIQNLNNSDAPFNYYDGQYDPRIEINKGDLLFSWSGTVGSSFGPHIWAREKALLNQHIFKVLPKTIKNNKFAYYGLKHITAEIEKQVNGAVGLVHITKEKLNEFEIFWPNSSEQKRIVAILDEAFTGVSRAKEIAEKNLANSKAIFKSNLESIFLQFNEEWIDATLEKVLDTQPRNGWSPPAANHSSSGTPVLTLSSVTGFQFKPEKVKFTSATTEANRHYWVTNGDFLITRSNTPELVGHVAIANGIKTPTIYPDLIMKMNLNPNKALTQFIHYQLQTMKLRIIITGRAQGANPTMKKIGKEAVQTLPIRITSISNQKQIVAKLDALSAETKKLETIYRQKLASLEELKKSILAKAFSGALTGTAS